MDEVKMEIYNKYRIEHWDGTPLKGKQYFVLRLDSDNPEEAARVAKAMRAYQEKLRNCDVGTAEEQVQRFKEYCESNMQYYRDMFGTHEGADGWDCREDCPIGKMIDKNDSLCDHCELVWSQMPYEPKGDKTHEQD